MRKKPAPQAMLYTGKTMIRFIKNKYLNALIHYSLLAVSFIPQAVCAQPTIFGLPPSIDVFYGRGNEIIEMNNALNSYKDEAAVVITGMSGIGKTSLARQYMEKHKSEYDFILWINGKSSLEAQLYGFIANYKKRYPKTTHSWSPNNDVKTDFRCILEESPNNYLVVIDDPASFEQVQEILPQKYLGNKNHHIVASTNSDKWKSPMTITALPEEDAIKLISDITGENDYLSTKYLVQKLHGHPLALKLAATFIKETPSLNIKEFSKILDTRKQSVIQGPLNGICNTIDLVIEKVKLEMPEAASLAELNSILAPKNIPEKFLQTWFDEKYSNTLKFHQAMRILAKYHLLSPMQNSNQSSTDRCYHMHDLVQEALFASLTEIQKKQLVTNSISSFQKVFLKNNKDTLFSSATHVIPHFIKVTDFADTLNLDDKRLFSLKLDILEHIMITKRDYAWARNYLSSIEPSFFEKCHHKDLLMRYHTDASNVNLWHADNHTALSNLNKALDFYVPGFKKESLAEYFRTLLYKAAAETCLGNITNSENLYDNVKDLINKHGYDGGLNSPFATLINKALLVKTKADNELAKGHYETALSSAKEYIDILDEFRLINQQDMHVATTYYFYIVRYLSEFLNSNEAPKQESIDALNDIHQRCLLEIDNIASDRGHGMVLAIMALGHLKKGDIQQAEEHALQSINTLNSWFGKINHGPEQGFVNLLLGYIYEQKDDCKTALNYLKASEEAYLSSLETTKIDNVSILYTLLSKVSFRMHSQLGLSYYTTKHNEIFGALNPRSMNLADNNFYTPFDSIELIKVPIMDDIS